MRLRLFFFETFAEKQVCKASDFLFVVGIVLILGTVAGAKLLSLNRGKLRQLE